jgi:large subunit ribosomal protein L30
MPSRKADTTTAKKKVAKKRTVTSRAARASEKRLRIRQVRSGIGSPGTVQRTLTALGLRHHQDETTAPDNASIRGMLRKVQHLVQVVAEED